MMNSAYISEALGLPQIKDPSCVQLADRTVTYSVLGDPGLTRCVIYHHGIPGSRCEAAFLHRAALDQGISILSINRPGIGGSSPDPAFTPAQWPALVEELLRLLGVERCAVLGVSGGAPYALALAATLKQATQLLLVSGVAPLCAPNALHKVVLLNRLGLRTIRAIPHSALPIAGAIRTLFLLNPSAFVKGMTIGLGEDDKAKFKAPGVEELFALNFSEHFAQDASTFARELRTIATPWNVPHVTVPTSLWHGDDDRIVSHTMAAFLNKTLPHSRLTIIPGKGHLVVAELAHELCALI